MNRATKSRFLDMQALTALGHLRFTTKHHIEGSYSGRHRSRRKGGAGELADFREYSGGEDLRHLDWKVYSRTGRAYIRLYQDETNLLCTLAIDVSGSMRMGAESERDLTGSRLEYTQYLTTALSEIIVRAQDQVGLAVLADELKSYLPPSSSQTNLMLLQDTIEKLDADETRTMAAGLRDLFERSKRRGVLLLCSDFLMEDLEEVFAAIRLFRHAGWEVVTLHMVHPDEERLPDALACRFVGLEGEGSVDCRPEEIRTIYQQRFEAHIASVRNFALAAGCDWRLVSTAIPYLQTLGGFLVERTG